MEFPENVVLNQLIGMRLRQMRSVAGLSQPELATRAGLTRAALVNIENGRNFPSIPLLYRLCKTLGCSADYLLTTGPYDAGVPKNSR